MIDHDSLMALADDLELSAEKLRMVARALKRGRLDPALWQQVPAMVRNAANTARRLQGFAPGHPCFNLDKDD